MEWKKSLFVVSDDISRINVAAVHKYLSESYWAKGRSLETVKASVKNSFCLGLYTADQQVGFARAVTDYTTFAYLCDVYVLPEFQRKDLGHFLMQCLFDHPELRGVRWLLKTTYAQSLYRDFGFEEVSSTFGWMSRNAIT